MLNSKNPNTEISADTTRLSGNMGVGELSMSVLAFSSPLATVAGTMPVLMMFGGNTAPAIYLILTALLLVFSVGFVTMSRYIENPGGFYSFVTEGLGRPAGMGGAFLALFGYLFIGFFVPAFFAVTMQSFVETTLNGPEIAWYWYALGIIAITTILAYHRIDLSAKVLTVVMALEVLVIVVFDVAAFLQGTGQTAHDVSLSFPAIADAGLGLALLFAIGNFFGFEATVIYRDEVKDPKRTIPRATYLAVAGIGIFYALAAWAYVVYFGSEHAQAAAETDTANLFTGSVNALLGKVFTDIVVILILTSALACMLSIQNITARYGFVLAKDRALPRLLSQVHPKHLSPYIAASAVGAFWAIATVVLAFLKIPAETIYPISSGSGTFSVLLLMFIASVAVFVYFLRRRRRLALPVWKTLLAPFVSSCFLGFVTYVAIKNFPELIGGDGVLSWVFLCVTFCLFVGGVVYALILRTKRPEAYARIGHQRP